MENENVTESVISDIDITSNSIKNREKRIRKSVTRLSDVYDKTFDLKSDRVIKPISGNGIKLGDIKRIQDAVHRSKLTGQLSKNLHLLCYRSIGKANKRLGSIKKFNGFGSNDEGEFKKRLSLVEKMKMDDLKLICDLLNVHSTTGKSKKDIGRGLVEYLQCPKETGSENFRMSALRRKIKLKVEKKEKSKGKLEKRNKPNVVDIEKVSMDSAPLSDISNDGSMDSSSDGSATQDEQNGTKAGKKQTKQNIGQSGETANKINDEKSDQIESEKEEKPREDEELATEELPDELLKEKISAILRGADLSKITLNQVCDGVVDQFPDVDLVLRRPHIKSLVKQVIDQSS